MQYLVYHCIYYKMNVLNEYNMNILCYISFFVYFCDRKFKNEKIISFIFVKAAEFRHTKESDSLEYLFMSFLYSTVP